MDNTSHQQQFLYADAMASATWATGPDGALFYDQAELNNAPYAMLQQQHDQQTMPMQLQSPAELDHGVLTRSQRARASHHSPAPSQPVTPDALSSTRRSPVYTSQYMFGDPSAPFMASPTHVAPLSMAAMQPTHYHPAHGSPQYPSTPSTVSSAPSSRIYHSAGGRSTSPAVSVASTSLTSLSGGNHASFHTQDAQQLADCTMDTAPDVSPHVFRPEPAALPAFDTSAIPSQGIPSQAGKAPRGKKTRLYNIDRKAICMWANAHPEARQEDIAAKYGVERSTISKILKQKQKWLTVPEGEELKIVKHRPSKFPALEKRLLIHLKQFARSTPPVTLTDQLIRTKAREVADEIGIGEDKFKASSGWVENFKHRHNIRRGVLVGRRRFRHVGPDGELTGDDESDYENAILDGEEGLTREERLAQRAEAKRERLELFAIAEEQIMEEYGDQIENGIIDEELRLELITARRTDLLRAKRAGKPVGEVLEDEPAVTGIAYNDLHAIMSEEMRLKADPNAKPMGYAILAPIHPVASVSGVVPYDEAAASNSAQGEPSLANVNAALSYVTHALTEEYMTREERAAMNKLRERVEKQQKKKDRAAARRAQML